ncbi:MAG: hypothetical protein LBT68_06500, partial [Spirochaetales bacterium]|nr:hypothetical protein [Spirochaetales bacterium]
MSRNTGRGGLSRAPRTFTPGLAIMALFLSAYLAGCARPADTQAAAPAVATPAIVPAAIPIQISAEKRLARAVVQAMTTEEKCAQLLMIAVGIEPAVPKDFARLIETVPAGAILLLGYNIAESPAKIMSLAAEFQKIAGVSGKGVPFLITVDHEGGTVYRLGAAATRIPGASRAGAFLEKNPAPEASANDAAARLFSLYKNSAAQLSLLGFSLNLAPVLEPLNDANREFLRYRSYGADEKTVSRAGGIFIGAMREGGVLAVAKHFPGTGGGDPHEAATYSGVSTERDLLPFREAVAAYDLGALMVSHAIAPDIDPALPVSVSAPALSWIRRRLDFKGIILTDDVNMKAVSVERSPEEAAVMAVCAGADMIMYLDERGITKAHAALVNAVREERLPQARLDEAAVRVLEQKVILKLWHLAGELTASAADNSALEQRLREFAA